MALPFIAGALLGAAAVVAYNNKNELKKVADKGLEKTKEVADGLKKTATSTAQCVKEKLKEEKEPQKEEKLKRGRKPKKENDDK